MPGCLQKGEAACQGSLLIRIAFKISLLCNVSLSWLFCLRKLCRHWFCCLLNKRYHPLSASCSDAVQVLIGILALVGAVRIVAVSSQEGAVKPLYLFRFVLHSIRQCSSSLIRDPCLSNPRRQHLPDPKPKCHLHGIKFRISWNMPSRRTNI